MQLTIQIVLTERKTSLVTIFPQLLKIIAKKAETFASEKGKVVSSNIQERLNFERKLERIKTRIKIVLSASPSQVFPHKVYNIRFEKQIRILSLLIVPIRTFSSILLRGIIPRNHLPFFKIF